MALMIHWPPNVVNDKDPRLSSVRMMSILPYLGNPHHDLKNIFHVTGTNGKGSVCKYIESICLASGFSVGLYTSPHIHRFNERIVLNNNEISDNDLYFYTEKVRNVCEYLKIEPSINLPLTNKAFDLNLKIFAK